MTNKEAIYFLNDIKEPGMFPVMKEEYKEALEMAVKALEKQIPKKIIYTTRCGYCENVTVYRCPACKTDVTGSSLYCWKCGQALDWSEE